MQATLRQPGLALLSSWLLTGLIRIQKLFCKIFQLNPCRESYSCKFRLTGYQLRSANDYAQSFLWIMMLL